MGTLFSIVPLDVFLRDLRLAKASYNGTTEAKNKKLNKNKKTQKAKFLSSLAKNICLTHKKHRYDKDGSSMITQST